MQDNGLHEAEASNQPKVFRGLVSDWPAIQLWQGHEGLQHLSKLAGAAQVQAMLNDKHDSLFFGDIRQFHPSSCTFAAFLASVQQGDLSDKVHVHQQQHNRDSQTQAYLAQASLDWGQPLHALQQDISIPEVISHADVSHTNLWMNFRTSRCSLHYDPYHNLLCMVQGQKTVKLMSPEATALLYPHPVLGESPNHSHVNFAAPDLQVHPLYKQALQLQQEFVLQAGDALFIPEGWWHQVDSQDMTIAVNFWWRSAFSKSLQPHMYAYYLRRIMDGLLDEERHKALQSVRPHAQLQTLYQGLTDISKGLTSETDDVSSAAESFASSSEESSASQSTSEESEAATAATCGPEATALSPDSPDVSGRGQMAPPGQLQHTDAAPDRDAATAEMGTSTSPSKLCCSPDTSFPERPGPRKRKASTGRASATSHSGTAEASGCSLHDSDGKHLEQPVLQQGCLEESCDQQQHDICISGNHGSEDHHRHQDKKHCRSNGSSQQQPVLSQLHRRAMGLLAGAVNDGVSLEQQSEDEAGLESPVTCILHTLQPADVQSVLLLMAQHAPHTLEGLFMYALSPAAAEILTQKLEAASTESGCEDQQRFYDAVYGVVDEPQEVLHQLLDLKESLSWHVCKHALSLILGIECTLRAVATS